MTYKYTFNTKQIEKISFYLMRIKKNKITILEMDQEMQRMPFTLALF